MYNIKGYKNSEDEDDLENSLFYKTIWGRGTYKKTITLPAGEYNIAIVHDIDEDFYDYFDEDWDYEDNREEGRYSVILTGRYIPELSSNSVTLKEGEEKTLKVKGTNESVTWKSSNKSVASVSSKGVVKAKKAGKATITATCGKYTLKCKVTVEKKPVTYSFLAKKLKEFAKKNKNFTFKTIDSGRRARLSARVIGGTDSSKIESGGYGMLSYLQPYIEIVKKKNTVSTSSKVNASVLKKFNTMLGQSSLVMRTESLDGAYFGGGVTTQVRNNWKKLVKEYNTLLKEY